jgi:hypothetical protein
MRKRTYPDDIAAGEKQCTQCHTIKLLDQFRLRKKDGHDYYPTRCITCSRENELKYFYEHREERNNYSRKRMESIRKRDRNLYNAKARSEGISSRLKLRCEVLCAYGGICACCGETNPYFLQIDHINGGGRKHRRTLGSGGVWMYQWLKNQGYPQCGYRLLCANCNSAFGFWGFCPHEGKGKQLELFTGADKNWLDVQGFPEFAAKLRAGSNVMEDVA